MNKQRKILITITYNEMGTIIDTKAEEVAPSVEPKQGEWMPVIEANEFGETYQSGIFCSECGETLGCEANFCPNCGADMGGGKK